MAKWIIELEPGVFLVAADGDPGRTLQAENATVFISHPRARNALLSARKYRPFKKAKVTLAPLTPNMK